MGTGERQVRHGHARRDQSTRTYRAWESMRSRCLNPKHKNYGYYGGRGIRICARWDFFENFLEDMGEPEPGMTLDRIDSDGDYTPENCRWATWTEQNRNMNRVAHVTVGGETLRLKEWAERLGVKYHTLWYRYKHGLWPERKS